LWFNPRTWSAERASPRWRCVSGRSQLLFYASTHAFEPRDLAVSYVARAIDYGSGVSPTLPVLFLGLAIVLWSLAELARLRTPNVALADDSTHG
jgi:hypothetical protein